MNIQVDCRLSSYVPLMVSLLYLIILCSYLKVPSFPDDIAMALIEEELGQPWQNIYSELSSSPIAAG